MFGEEEEGLFGVFVGFEGEEVCFELEEGEELGEGEEVADVGDEGGVCVEVGEAVVEELGEDVGIYLMDGDAIEGGYVVTELEELKMAHV